MLHHHQALLQLIQRLNVGARVTVLRENALLNLFQLVVELMTTGRSDRSATKPDSDAARSQADQSAAPSDRDRQPADQNADNQNAQRASNRGGGVPWGWIVLGIVVVAIILGLIGRGTSTDRVERTDRVETMRTTDRDIVRDRRDDDIRRVG